MIAWLKKNGPYVGALFGVLMIPYVLITTPSLSESQQRLGVMRSDLQKMVDNGGKIAYGKEVNKYGVASLSVEVVGELVNAQKLADLGWVPISQSGGEYCKDGIVLKAYISNQLFMGEKILSMNFRYTSQTIGICKKITIESRK
jgi:hypothetical protein